MPSSERKSSEEGFLKNGIFEGSLSQNKSEKGFRFVSLRTNTGIYYLRVLSIVGSSLLISSV